ncbi:MAG: DUF2262 domain-containing protein [Candidatus Brocadiaceae bacterium]|nr:DUF2262 domain-containing protein [Candidatus Brocadiaceae bacterium]
MNEQSNDILEDLQKNRQGLMDQLNKRGITDIFGVVDASGAGGFKLQGEERWTLLFSFDAWRFSGTSLRKDKLTFRMVVTEENLETMKKSINPFDILHVRAGVVKNSAFEGTHGLLVELVGSISSDRELNSHADELKKPVVFTDSFFGFFGLDRKLNWYQSETIWKSKFVRLNLSMDNCKDEKVVLGVARSLWSAQESWSQQVCDYITANLSDQAAPWLDDVGDMVTPDLFESMMEVETIIVYPDSSFEFWYKDSGQFLGQPVIVYGNLSDGPMDIDIPSYKLGQSRPSQESNLAVLA